MVSSSIYHCPASSRSNQLGSVQPDNSVSGEADSVDSSVGTLTSVTLDPDIETGPLGLSIQIGMDGQCSSSLDPATVSDMRSSVDRRIILSHLLPFSVTTETEVPQCTFCQLQSLPVNWPQEVNSTANRIEHALGLEITEADKEIISHYCQNARPNRWFEFRTHAALQEPEQNNETEDVATPGDLKALNETVLESFILSNDHIRRAILDSNGAIITDDSITTLLHLTCRFVEADGSTAARKMIVTATDLVKQYVIQSVENQTFNSKALQLTTIVNDKLQNNLAKEAGLVMGILISAMHHNADAQHALARNTYLLIAIAIPCLWAWSFLGEELAWTAAVAVTLYTLYEKLYSEPHRHLNVLAIEKDVRHSVYRSSDGTAHDFWFGLQHAKDANCISKAENQSCFTRTRNETFEGLI